MGKLTKLPRAEQWADRICTQLGKSVESIIDVGRLLVKAKADLPHGEWGRLFEEDLVPFGQNTAGQLMAIASHPALSNSEHAQNLPASWTTLYQLTRVEPKRLTAAFKDGIITPDMPRKAVTALLPSKPRRAAAATPDDEAEPELIAASMSAARFTEDEQAQAITKALQPAADLVEAWPDGVSLVLFVHRVRQLLRYLERLESQHHEASA